ncbi:MAG: type II secretion system F family protein [Candidatus Nealsonbacteria bacterium]|nr:type II secretion system F family protein [Candidatus Nealsonbacteria bacterium]
MPKYFYIAKSLKGEEKYGTLETKDEKELVQTLRQEGYFLIKAELEEKQIQGSAWWEIGRVSLVEKIIFTRNLKLMVSAGVSLPRSLLVLANLTKNQKFKKILLKVREEVIKGKGFSDSLAKHPRVFSELFINMVKVGEESGTIEGVLKILTEQQEKENEIKTKIKGAMIYPMVIISTMIGMGILMMILVVPQLAETFQELNVELPLLTKLVISFGVFLAERWLSFILIILFLFILLKILLKTKTGKTISDKIILKIPVISPIVKKTYSAYTVRTLGSLISAGVPIVRSLEIVSRTLGNVFFKEAIVEAAERIKKGGKLSEAISSYDNLFSHLVIEMVGVGEETGQTSEILAKLADFFEEEVATITKNLSTIIEPILLLLVGIAVGLFAISIIQPIYSMLGAVR